MQTVTSIEQICAAMSSKSVLYLAVGDDISFQSLFPAKYGMTEIHKVNNNRVKLFFCSSSVGNDFYQGSYAANMTPGFSGWARNITNANSIISHPSTDNNRLSDVKLIDATTTKPYLAVYINGNTSRYGFIPITKD